MKYIVNEKSANASEGTNGTIYKLGLFTDTPTPRAYSLLAVSEETFLRLKVGDIVEIMLVPVEAEATVA